MKKLSILFAAVLMATMSFAGTQTYSYTFEKSTLTGTGSIVLGEVTWTQAYTGDWYGGWDGNTKKGQQIGSGSKHVTAFSLTTNGIPGTITKVVVNASMASSGGASLAIKVGDVQYLNSTTLTTTATDYTGTGTAAGAIEISYKNSKKKAFYIKSIIITYELEEGTPSAPTFTPTDADFADTTTVTLAAEEGLDIYYTLDGTEPTVSTGTKYAAAISLNKTTTIKAIAYNAATKKSSAVVEKTYTCYSLITTCAGLADAAKNDFVELGKVTVIYVNGANTYICDNTGYGLLYKYNYGLKAGQVAEGIKGRVTIYSGLPEIEPSVDTAALTITEGTVPEPIELATVPTAADLNKYVHITGVATPDSTWKSSDKTTEARTLKVAWGKDSLTLYNTFKIDQTFDAGCYHIVGFVTCYNTTIQIAVVSATAAVYSVVADVNNDDMGTIEGLPAEKIAYGTEITLTAKPKTGYKFVNWTDATGAEVSTEAEYTFTVTGEVTYTANFAPNTAIDNTTATKTATKRIENGTLVIEKNGIRYNALGTVVE